MTEARAIIRWVPAARGGRSHPPQPVTGYATIARFESDSRGERGWWSLQVASASCLREAEVIDAQVRFLAAEVPADLLTEGQRFELMEGARVVAKGVVLPPRLAAPATISDFELALLG